MLKNSASAEAIAPCCAFDSRFDHGNSGVTPGCPGFEAAADRAFPEFRPQVGLWAADMWIVEGVKEKTSATGGKMGFRRAGNRNGGHHGFRRNTFSCASGAVHAYFRAKPAPAFQASIVPSRLKGQGHAQREFRRPPLQRCYIYRRRECPRTRTLWAEKSRPGN